MTSYNIIKKEGKYYSYFHLWNENFIFMSSSDLSKIRQESEKFFKYLQENHSYSFLIRSSLYEKTVVLNRRTFYQYIWRFSKIVPGTIKVLSPKREVIAIYRNAMEDLISIFFTEYGTLFKEFDPYTREDIEVPVLTFKRKEEYILIEGDDLISPFKMKGTLLCVTINYEDALEFGKKLYLDLNWEACLQFVESYFKGETNPEDIKKLSKSIYKVDSSKTGVKFFIDNDIQISFTDLSIKISFIPRKDEIAYIPYNPELFVFGWGEWSNIVAFIPKDRDISIFHLSESLSEYIMDIRILHGHITDSVVPVLFYYDPIYRNEIEELIEQKGWDSYDYRLLHRREMDQG